MRALVTGADGGLGKEFVALLRADGCEVIEIIRKEFDLAKVGVAEKIFATYSDVDVLINNAGFATHGRFVDLDLETERNEMMVNMVTLTELTKLYAKEMVKRGSGKILNIASTAAYLPGPMMAVYYASKAYVLSFSEAVANELQGTGVSVTCVCPGPTNTAFADRATMRKTVLFQAAMQPKDVALVGYLAMKAGKSTVVVGWRNWIQVVLSRFVPRTVLARVVQKLQ